MLEINALVKVFPGPVTALRGIDLNISTGMFGLLGPNGSGKTTLMRILAGLLEPTSGTILFKDYDIVKSPEKLWPHLGYLPQHFGFYPALTGEAMLMHMLRLKGVLPRDDLKTLCAELLERVNLSYAARQRVKEYSGGMKQRLGIAQALAGNPKVIIVDEPTAGLDPEERIRFYQLLAELSETRTVLLSTHIVEDVAMLCPRFGVIKEGRLIADTTPQKAKGLIAGQIYESIVNREQFESLSTTFQITRSYLVEGKNHVRIHVPNGQPPEGFLNTEPTLDDAYFVLMQEAEG